MDKKIVGLFLLFSFSFFIFYPSFSFGAAYKWRDEKGVLHFTDNPSLIPPKYRNQVKKMKQRGSFSVVPAQQPKVRKKSSQTRFKKDKKRQKKIGEYRRIEEMSEEEIKTEIKDLEESMKLKNAKIRNVERKRDLRLYTPNRFYTLEQFNQYKKTKQELEKEFKRYQELLKEVTDLSR